LPLKKYYTPYMFSVEILKGGVQKQKDCEKIKANVKVGPIQTKLKQKLLLMGNNIKFINRCNPTQTKLKVKKYLSK
jgi:hypothetical protein